MSPHRGTGRPPAHIEPPPHADRFLVVAAVDGELGFVGPGVPRVIGFDRKDLTGADLLNHVHPDERSAVSNALSAVATDRRVVHRIRHANGGYVWVQSVVDDELAPGFGGRVVTARCVDIEHSFPERFREFLEYGTDIVTVVDTNGRVRYESPSVEEVLGYEQGSLVGRSPLGYVHPEDRDRVTEEFYQALTRPDDCSALEYRYRTADDDWVWLESRTRGLPEDTVGRLLINSREITERKRRERRIADRNERLDRFASIVSHDLRNPLAVVKGSIEMARYQDDTAPLERGERAAERIDQLITELLTLARQGEGIDDPTEATLASVAYEAWETIDDDDATLVVADDPQIFADRSRLRQALENLFRNAVEHGVVDETGSVDDRERTAGNGERGTDNSERAADTDEDRGTSSETDDTSVRVVVASTTDGFVVADDGPGIDPDNVKKVFEPGFTTNEEGTGYGLDIVREICEAHGWSVTVATDGVTPVGNAAVDPTAHVEDDRVLLPDGARFEIRGPTPEQATEEPWIGE
ncbi:PAS domain-containing protein [Halorubrum vacuolatum]|uniref:histidine kinase n=1 Tax=Halorubrum vacuolatum TaxID=63740 RepID=A0A238W8I9_HALVU|nr:PAS domain-containing protein [Halorubrum vacuolatum]SNR42862.1 PAS domain S-box-containing protein [Halorubrum vacuolatum]